MTSDEILQAAKEATNNQPIYGRKEFTFSAEELQRFAAVIEKRTIERCAVVCEMLRDVQIYADKQEAQNDCAAAIRKLGEQ
jgi:hypothetical protein